MIEIPDTDSLNNEALILDSWTKNASEWARAIQNQTIASRQAITDSAIINAVVESSPHSVLDIGCGEGWLVRALAQCNIAAYGIDAIPDLVRVARSHGIGRFDVMAYEEISATRIRERFDVVVCNFSLLGKRSVEDLFATIPALLHPGGVLIVQTLHPLSATNNLPYRDGWRDGSWEGIGGNFVEPSPWYFRTLPSWFKLFHSNGMPLISLQEPTLVNGSQPASLLLIGRLSAQADAVAPEN